MTSMLTVDLKEQLITGLEQARMQHIQWVTEVLREHQCLAEEDHTKCQFGLWMSQVRPVLGEIEEFQDIDIPHRELHMVYKLLKNNPEHSSLRDELKVLSFKLIASIELLEDYLKEN